MCHQKIVDIYGNDFPASDNLLFNKNPLTRVLLMCIVALNIKTLAVMKHKFGAFSGTAKK